LRAEQTAASQQAGQQQERHQEAAHGESGDTVCMLQQGLSPELPGVTDKILLVRGLIGRHMSRQLQATCMTFVA
jgi:hypothetical protein